MCAIFDPTIIDKIGDSQRNRGWQLDHVGFNLGGTIGMGHAHAVVAVEDKIDLADPIEIDRWHGDIMVKSHIQLFPMVAFGCIARQKRGDGSLSNHLRHHVLGDRNPSGDAIACPPTNDLKFY